MISSIGVALALVRDVVERVIPNPTPEDLKRIRPSITVDIDKSKALIEAKLLKVAITLRMHRAGIQICGKLESPIADDQGFFQPRKHKEANSGSLGSGKQQTVIAPRIRP